MYAVAIPRHSTGKRSSTCDRSLYGIVILQEGNQFTTCACICVIVYLFPIVDLSISLFLLPPHKYTQNHWHTYNLKLPIECGNRLDVRYLDEINRLKIKSKPAKVRAEQQINTQRQQ